MKTALISDHKLSWASLSPILRRMEKNKISFTPAVVLPVPNGDNVVEYMSSLGINGIVQDDDPEAIVYCMGEEKKYYDYFKSFFNKNKTLLLIKIDRSGAML